MGLIIDWKKDAFISPCGEYREWLTRNRGKGTGKCIFIMLNPSTADAMEDDPTIRRCCAFAFRFNKKKLLVINLFTGRATNPDALYLMPNPVGPRGAHVIERTLKRAKRNDLVICAWGTPPSKKSSMLYREWMRQAQFVVDRASYYNVPLWCLEYTKAKHPKHPLYVRGDVELKQFPYE